MAYTAITLGNSANTLVYTAITLENSASTLVYTAITLFFLGILLYYLTHRGAISLLDVVALRLVEIDTDGEILEVFPHPGQ